ncbi:ABC transporter ATP-binding protein [Senegalia sp. (in: firmicutes)]|uniref:ABC transporter ATP-binding protein n=1 Tax=Senegalia sp. (in: firmicutes) TaxID=1924098 RepID=UPI003F9D718B
MINLEGVSFRYENSISDNEIRNINLNIKKGEVVLLCGESGCGKTSLTRLINGLIPNYFPGDLSGKIEIDGQDVAKLSLEEISKKVGSVFQNPRSQFYCMDTNSELAFECENQGLPVDDILQRIELTVSRLHIEDLMNRNIFKISGGEKQKIACACIHTSSPEVIVLDEPSSNLDSQATKSLGKIIKHWKDEGKTIILAEHRLHYLKDIADRMIFMKDGEIEREFKMDDAKKLESDELASMGLRTLKVKDLKLEGQNTNIEDREIELLDFCYSFKKDEKVLDIEKLNLPKGKIIGLIGHNGAGKTTFGRCLCGLNKKFKGKIRLGKDTFKKKECIQNAYMVMQDVNHQLFTESVVEEVSLSMKEDDEKRVKEILQSLNLSQMEELHPMSLSGGQKQRVAIASAIASEREIIVFDEPTSGLDLKHMIHVAENLIKLKDMGKTILIITHDLELILRTCEYIVHMESGKIEKSYFLDEKTSYKLKDFFIE